MLSIAAPSPHPPTGYPFRRTFDEFMRTYWQLYPAGRFAAQQSAEAGAAACRTLLAGCGLSEGADYQIGTQREGGVWGAGAGGTMQGVVWHGTAFHGMFLRLKQRLPK